MPKLNIPEKIDIATAVLSGVVIRMMFDCMATL